jgi:hypothetical protein
MVNTKAGGRQQFNKVIFCAAAGPDRTRDF